MKQFLVFAGSTYYPSGGWNDFRGSFSTERLCLLFIANASFSFDWFQIINSETGENVSDFENLGQDEIDELNGIIK